MADRSIDRWVGKKQRIKETKRINKLKGRIKEMIMNGRNGIGDKGLEERDEGMRRSRLRKGGGKAEGRAKSEGEKKSNYPIWKGNVPSCVL